MYVVWNFWKLAVVVDIARAYAGQVFLHSVYLGCSAIALSDNIKNKSRIGVKEVKRIALRSVSSGQDLAFI